MQKKKREINPDWRRAGKKLPWLLIIPFFYALALIAARYPNATEKLYGFIYPYIAAAMGFISSFTGKISLAEILAISAVLAIVTVIVVNIIRLITGRLKFAGFVNFIVSLCLVAGILYGNFLFLWGFNYNRPSLYERMELPVEERSSKELEALCYKLAREAKAAREDVSEDDSGVFNLPGGYQSYFLELPRAYEKLAAKEELFSGKRYPAKSVFFSEAMSYAGISGIFFPFTGEANVNVDQPPLLLLASAAHEMAHASGVAPEDEANFVSYLACISTDSASIRYSGLMLALIHCTNKLYDADKDMYFGVRNEYSDGMVRDITSYNAYWNSYEGPVEETVNNINDGYLKFNQQTDGVKSYGMMVDLLLAYYADDIS